MSGVAVSSFAGPRAAALFAAGRSHDHGETTPTPPVAHLSTSFGGVAKPSLDERYLAFSARTQDAFAAHPRLEPLRQFVFRELLIQRRADGWWQRAKHWMRPLRRRSHTGTVQRAEVLVWLESGREVIGDALLPVYQELMRRGVSAALVADGGPSHLPPTAVRFRYPAQGPAPRWAAGAWDALCAYEPALRERSLRRAFLHASAMLQGRLDELERLLEAIAPRTVVAASTQLWGGAALAVVARAHGTSSLLQQHGVLQPFYTPLLTDHMLTWGPSSDDTLVTLGIPRERLIATGSPRHDAMRPSDGAAAGERLRRALGLRDRPTFVFFSNGNDLVRNGEAPVECAQWLEAVAAYYANELNIVVRLHPNEAGSLYRSCRHLTITRDIPALTDTLDGCDFLGSLCSTVLYEGLLYGKPVWQFHAPGWPTLADNWQQGLALRVGSASQLRELVGVALAEGPRHRVDERLVARVFANHGRATQGVADVVTRR